MHKEIIKNIEVPTGNILIINGEAGKLECLSLGDYGKDVNLNQHKPVIHTDLMPLSKKWVITISSQYGCQMNCKFCDCPGIPFGGNASLEDLARQVEASMSIHPEITEGERLNLHFARMGEPTFNSEVIDYTSLFYELYQGFHKHPVVSTMMPNTNPRLSSFLSEFMILKNYLYGGNAGLQISINSTDEDEREDMFNHCALHLDDIAEILYSIDEPLGRKITLNFAIADYTIDANKLVSLFDPKYFICKLTPMHKTRAAKENNIKTEGDYTTHYPYMEIEQRLKDVGFDVLVFIASKEEDESRITCGNAILGDK